MKTRAKLLILTLAATLVVVLGAVLLSDQDSNPRAASGFPGAGGSVSCHYYGYFWGWVCNGNW